MDDLIINVPRKYLDYLVMHLKNLPEITTDKFKTTLLLKMDKLKVQLSYEEADLIRDLCGDRLQVVGFDNDYNLTEEGKFLVDLVDLLYTG
jgi:hypothetical protein